MSTKVKGLLKGLRYISQVFDEDKEKDMQIGFPTDVKHVAHIGWDGPSVDNPSWMKEYKLPGAFQSAPLIPSPGELKENPDIKWVSEDSNRRSRNANSSATKDKPEKARTSRRHSTTENGSNEDSTNKEPGTKSRRHHNKETSDGNKSSESSSKNNPDIPKKSRRKKSKEDGGSNRPSKSKGTSSSTTQTTESGPGQESESSGISKEKQKE